MPEPTNPKPLNSKAQDPPVFRCHLTYGNKDEAGKRLNIDVQTDDIYLSLPYAWNTMLTTLRAEIPDPSRPSGIAKLDVLDFHIILKQKTGDDSDSSQL